MSAKYHEYKFLLQVLLNIYIQFYYGVVFRGWFVGFFVFSSLTKNTKDDNGSIIVLKKYKLLMGKKLLSHLKKNAITDFL